MIDKYAQCKHCQGTGMNNLGICPICKGKGILLVPNIDGGDKF